MSGDGFETCEDCGGLLGATESRHLGLGSGVCDTCREYDERLDEELFGARPKKAPARASFVDFRAAFCVPNTARACPAALVYRPKRWPAWAGPRVSVTVSTVAIRCRLTAGHTGLCQARVGPPARSGLLLWDREAPPRDELVELQIQALTRGGR